MGYSGNLLFLILITLCISPVIADIGSNISNNSEIYVQKDRFSPEISQIASFVPPDTVSINSTIDEINRYNTEHNIRWIAGVTTVANLSAASRVHHLGLNQDLQSGRSPGPGSESIQPMEKLPASFDWRNNDGDWTTPVKDQGDCASSWAFAECGILESYWKRTVQNSEWNPDFSPQYLISCDQDDNGCSGGNFRSSMPYLTADTNKTTGMVNSSDYPYQGQDLPCINLTGKNRFSADSWGYVHASSPDQPNMNPGMIMPSIQELKTAIYTKGPIAVGMYVHDPFMYYTGGIYSDNSSSQNANHAVVLTGWGKENGTEYFIGKNSWGTDWGEGGWFRIATNSSQIGEGAVFFDQTIHQKLSITGIYPSSGQRDSIIPRIDITGTGFSSTDQVLFIRNSSPNLTFTGSVSGTNLSVPACNLTGAAEGTWDLMVINQAYGQSSRIRDAFIIRSPDPDAYLINATSDTESMIRPSGMVGVKRGNEQKFSFNSGNGSILINLVVDGEQIPVPFDKTYTFSNVTSNHSISVISGQKPPTPEAAFRTDISSGDAPLEVQFSDSSTGNPNKWLWTFGDESSSDEQNPHHLYSTQGNYTVTLWAQNGYGSDSVTRKGFIRVFGK